MPGLNFTAMHEHAQAAARNGLSSGEEETAATPGQRQVGSKARASDWAADRPPDVRTSSLVATGCPSAHLLCVLLVFILHVIGFACAESTSPSGWQFNIGFACAESTSPSG